MFTNTLVAPKLLSRLKSDKSLSADLQVPVHTTEPDQAKNLRLEAAAVYECGADAAYLFWASFTGSNQQSATTNAHGVWPRIHLCSKIHHHTDTTRAAGLGSAGLTCSARAW